MATDEMVQKLEQDRTNGQFGDICGSLISAIPQLSFAEAEAVIGAQKGIKTHMADAVQQMLFNKPTIVNVPEASCSQSSTTITVVH